MRTLAYIALAGVLAVLEATLPRLFHADLVRPLLTLPVVLHCALRLNTGEGALIAALCGLATESTGALPPGLATFTDVLLFTITRVALVGLSGEGPVFEFLGSGALAVLFHAITVLLERLLGGAATEWLPAAGWSAVATAGASPFVMLAVRRIDRIRQRHPGILSQ